MSDNKLYFCQEALDYANPFDCCNECHCENKKEQILCRKRMFLQSKRTIIGMDDGWIEFDWDEYQNAVDFIINHIDRLEWSGKMTKEEALAKIRELEDYIQELDKDDDLFLLSAKEYEKYKNKIPKINCPWWLRSPGDSDGSVVYVSRDCSVYEGGIDVRSYGKAVRPALKRPEAGAQIEGARIIYRQFPFILIDRKQGLYIAEVPIDFYKFDDKSNNYNTSEIRQFLKDWEKNR